MKKILTVVFVFHFAVVMLTSIFLALDKKQLPNKKAINRFGHYVYYEVKYPDFLSSIEKERSIYSLYTGTSSGYAFYSPNVPKVSYSFDFYDKEGHKIDLIDPSTFEVKVKVKTFNYFFSNIIFSDKNRSGIVQSLANNIFKKNPKLDYLEIYYNENDMEKKVITKKLIYKIQKNENKTTP